jgi:hypothetical protein
VIKKTGIYRDTEEEEIRKHMLEFMRSLSKEQEKNTDHLSVLDRLEKSLVKSGCAVYVRKGQYDYFQYKESLVNLDRKLEATNELNINLVF